MWEVAGAWLLEGKPGLLVLKMVVVAGWPDGGGGGQAHRHSTMCLRQMGPSSESPKKPPSRFRVESAACLEL